MSSSIRKVVIPAAGLGTRFLPATKVVPKEMLPVSSKPLIQLAVEEAVAAPVITSALYARFRSRIAHSFGEKVLSAMRNKFGGHVEGALEKKKPS